MSSDDGARIRQHHEALSDGELLRGAILEGGELREVAQGVIREVLEARFGTPAALLQRERVRTGQLWGRIQPVRTFARLRGPHEPVLGGRDVPPYDGVILLSDQGLGFVPASPPPPGELFGHLPRSGPLGDWWGALMRAAAVPEALRDARAVLRLPLSLRARLDATAAWIGREALVRLELRVPELRVVVEGAGDALCGVPPDAPELLERWAAQHDVPLRNREGEGVTRRIRGWLRRD